MVVLQVLAMWSIVGAAIIWFRRDEQRRRDASLSAQALRFATVPHYRQPVAHEAPTSFGL